MPRWKHKAAETSQLDLPAGVRLLRTLTGHAETVNSVAFDASGKRLASGSRDGTVRLWGTDSGLQICSFNGPRRGVLIVAFHPSGKLVASGGEDGAVRLWDADSGRLIRELEGHESSILSLAFDATGARLASGSGDNTVRLWEADSGRLLHTLEGHTGRVNSVSFDPRGARLVSGGQDRTVRLWEADSGRLLRTLEDSSGTVYSVSFNSAGGWLASGGGDETVRLWETDSGRLLRTLEGHTSVVDVVTFSEDDTLLASKSHDQTIRVWDCATWETLAVIPEAKLDEWIPALAFHPSAAPNRAVLATCGSPANTPANTPMDSRNAELCSDIHLWGLDLEVLRRHGASGLSVTDERSRLTGPQATGSAAPPRTVHHATAKIVLVGDSGVGKTGLGWRLAHGDYREHDSTHGQQFWVLKQLAATRADGAQCEAVLWDLAGQSDYRLIHALSIQDADLALILFDPANNRDPLGGAEYWLRQLPPGCPKILVAARVDRGHPTLTNDELAAFCERQGIAGGWVSTSAKENVGLDLLLERMKEAIPWDEKPVVSTDAGFKEIKDLVLTLKEQRKRSQIIFTVDELGKALTKRRRKGRKRDAAGGDPRESWTTDQLLTSVRHLASQGYVRLLTLSTAEQQILLVPELLNNLASSMVLEARRNPRGLGAVEEKRLFENSYRFRELESLSESDQALLLDGTITAFLENQLSYRCFRESWGEMKLLVFPELMNLKKPQRDDLVTKEGPSYVLTGSTENTFAALVVLLGYTDLFLRTDQAHNVAWFSTDDDEICGVRQIHDDSECTLVLLFGPDVSHHVRSVFEGLVEQVLACREVVVRRLRPVQCPTCQTPVDRTVMTRRTKAGKATVHCEECGVVVTLPPDEPLALRPDEQTEIQHEGAVASRRTVFEEVIYEMQRLAQAEQRPSPTCFVSYAWGNAEHERWVERRLAMDLEKAGINVILDRWDNTHTGHRVAERFLDRIKRADHVLVVGTRKYQQKYDHKVPETGTAVAAEIDIVAARLAGSEEERATVIPLLLEGEAQESLPPALQSRVRRDFRDYDSYFKTALELLLGLYGIDSRHPAAKHWKQKLAGDDFARRMKFEEDDDQRTDEVAMRIALQQVGRHSQDKAFAAGRSVVIEQDGKLVWLSSDGTTRPYEAELFEAHELEE